MIDINLIREKPEWVKEQIAKLNDTAPIDEILAADERRRTVIQEARRTAPPTQRKLEAGGAVDGRLKKLAGELADIEAAPDGQSASRRRC